MTAQNDVTIIENELRRTTKMTDEIRIYTSWSAHTYTAARGGEWIAAICGKMIKITYVKSHCHTQHMAQKSEYANTHPYTHTHTEKALERPIINQLKATAFMLQSHL